MRFTECVFVSAETVVDVPFDVARTRLVNLARRGWLVGASDDAYGEWGQALARVGPLGSAPGVSRLVDVRFRDVVTHDWYAVLALRWEAVGPGKGLFPVLDADIRLTSYGESGTLLVMMAVYRPPLAAVGAALDRVVLHRVASATSRSFLDRIGDAVADPAGAAAPEAADGAPGWPGFPLAPEEA
jgi:hypothetical protein